MLERTLASAVLTPVVTLVSETRLLTAGKIRF